MTLKFLLKFTEIKKFLILYLLNLSIIVLIAVLLFIGIKGFGKTSVNGFNLDPKPPAIINTGE